MKVYQLKTISNPNTPILLCKEWVKDDIEKEDYKGLIFLEVGEMI